MSLTCPKCASSGAYVERVDTMHVLRCRCGFYMHGVTLSFLQDCVAPSAPPKPPAPPKLPVVPKPKAPKVVPPSVGVISRVSRPQDGPSAQCAWTDCSAPARGSSKYCSRDCSNKNARRRHAVRKASSSVDTCP